MPRFRFSSILVAGFTAAVLAFLWLPVARLYFTGGTLGVSQIASQIGNAFFGSLSRALLWNTLILSFLTALLATALGIPVAFAASRGPRFLRIPILLLCALPMALPPTLMASAYLEYSRTPPARSVASLAASHALSINANLIAAPVLALCFFPLAAFAIWAALQNFPTDWEDAARLFGNPLAAAFKVLAPLLWPAIAGAGGLVAALAMWEMGAPDLLDAKTYTVQIYRAFSAGESSSSAAIAALPMLVLGALFFIPAIRALRFYEAWKVAGGNAARTPQTSSILLSLTTLAILGFSPLAPLLVFVAQAKPRDIFAQVWDANSDEIWNTILVPTVAAAGITIIALLLVLTWREYSAKTRRVVLSLCLAPLLGAPILLAVALLEFYNRAPFDLVHDSRFGLLLIGLAARFLPLGIFWIHQAMQRVSIQMEEAAQSVGASKIQIASHIFLPLLAPASLALVAVLFALCAGELSVAVLLNAPGGQTLPIPIFNQMHIGATESVAALSLTLVAISGGALWMLLGVWVKLKSL